MVVGKRKIGSMEKSAYPQSFCAAICYYANSQECYENCATKRDMSWFELRKDIVELPLFPIVDFINDMNAPERAIMVAVHIFAFEGGLTNGSKTFESSGSSRVSWPVEIHPVQPNRSEANTIYQADRKEISVTGIRSEKVVRE